MIELKNVQFSYEKVSALKDINLTIAAGESVALLGSNGCGKSTLLKMLNGILFPQKGAYYFQGDEVSKSSMKDATFAKGLHQKIGFIFQNSDTQLFCTNVYEEIAFAPRQMGLEEKEVRKRVEDCLRLLNLEEFQNRTPYHLSGGEKKKVALACILSMNPDIIVLDEPWNGLDPKTQRWLVNFLKELNARGKTIILSTHNLEFLEELTARAILFNEEHQIVADQKLEEILCNEKLLKEVNLVDQTYRYRV